MSRRASGVTTLDNDIDWCQECTPEGDTSEQPRERRRRRRRGRSEPACSECVPQNTRSTSSLRDPQSRRRSSSNTTDAVTSVPDPSQSVPGERRSASTSSSCSHTNAGSHSQSGSGRSRRRRSRPGRRRRMAATTAGSTNPTTVTTTTTTTTQESATTRTADPAPQEDLSNIGPQREAQRCQIRQWPHGLCFLFACLSCTISMFSISRFAILTIDYGAIFLVQFLLLSLLFGIPMLTFFASLGQYLGSGIIDMWRISPVFQGIGVSLMLSQGIYGLYNIAAISWLFIYFRDSFIASFDRYRWSMCFDGIKYGRSCDTNSSSNNISFYNPSWKLEETIPDYFSGIVLMRSAPTYPHSFTALRFQTLFNIVVIWMAVFIALSKGLRSYGRVVFVFGTFPILSFLVFATKIIGLLPMSHFKYWFMNTQWLEFLYNGQSWVCAARECFFTWGILGASILQLGSHNSFKHRLLRDTTSIVIITLVILLMSGILGVSMVLLIRSSGYDYVASSFETAESYEFLRLRPTSPRLMRDGRDFPMPNDISDNFEKSASGGGTRPETEADPFPIGDILASLNHESEPGSHEVSHPTQKHTGYKGTGSRFSPLAPNHRNPGRVSRLPHTPRHDREHVSFLAGVRILQNGRNTDKYSGYQVMRLATELMPAYAAILGPRILSPFWVVLFYLTLIVMGLAQQMALFHTVASGLIAIRPDHFMQFESSLTFMSCLLGLVLCFPMATEFGAFIVYFFDYTIGSGWWLMLLYSFLIFAVFVIRGRPYSGENVARMLLKPESLRNDAEESNRKLCCYGASWIIPLLVFTWNVVLPIGLVILCIVSFKACYFAEMFDWTTHTGYLYLPSWVREIGAMMQLLPLLLVPFVAIIQTCRYFLNGSDELYEKINLLYRPNYASQVHHGRHGGASRGGHVRPGRQNGVVLTNYNARSQTTEERTNSDPPPKYTPPPSYSTATGARIARFLRQSFRQSVRRFRGETWTQNSDDSEMVEGNFTLRTLRSRQPSISGKLESLPPPPDYATVIIETSRHTQNAGSERSYGSFSPAPTLPTVSSGISSSDVSVLYSTPPQSSRLNIDKDIEIVTNNGYQLAPDLLARAATSLLGYEQEKESVAKSLSSRPLANASNTSRANGSDFVSVSQVTVLMDIDKRGAAQAKSQSLPQNLSRRSGAGILYHNIDKTESDLNSRFPNHPRYQRETQSLLPKDSDLNDFVSVGQVTVLMEPEVVESEKPKRSRRRQSNLESTSLSDSTMASSIHGHFEPNSLTDRLNNLDETFVRGENTESAKKLENNLARPKQKSFPSYLSERPPKIHSGNYKSLDDDSYAPSSTQSYGETMILSDGFNHLDSALVRKLNRADDSNSIEDHTISRKSSIEIEKPKAQRSIDLTEGASGYMLGVDESSTDDFYIPSSTLSYGETVILPDGLNNLDSNLVRTLNNNLDTHSPDGRLKRLEPRGLIFNIPPDTDTDSVDSNKGIKGVMTIHVDTSSSVI